MPVTAFVRRLAGELFIVQQSLDYYRQRETQERVCADRAETEMARNIHLDLADRYAALLGHRPKSRVTASVSPNP